jgi:hypothetical protein
MTGRCGSGQCQRPVRTSTTDARTAPWLEADSDPSDPAWWVPLHCRPTRGTPWKGSQSSRRDLRHVQQATRKHASFSPFYARSELGASGQAPACRIPAQTAGVARRSARSCRGTRAPPSLRLKRLRMATQARMPTSTPPTSVWDRWRDAFCHSCVQCQPLRLCPAPTPRAEA